MQDDLEKKNLLTIGDASEYLGISIDTLRRWERKGRIEPLRSPGGHRYYKKEDLDSLFGKKYVRTAETIRSGSTYNTTSPQSISSPKVETEQVTPIRIDPPISQISQNFEGQLTSENPDNFTNFPFLQRSPREVKIPEPEKIQVSKEEFLLTPQEAYYKQQSVSVLTPPEISRPVEIPHQPAASVPNIEPTVTTINSIPQQQQINTPVPPTIYRQPTNVPNNGSRNVVINKDLLIYGGIALGVIFLLFAWYAVYISSQRVLSPIP